MADTSIEWTDKVWNVVTGCTKVSQGCRNCFAESIANRRLPHGGFTDRPFTEVRCHPDRLQLPLKWRKPRRVFVNSMSDLFHEDVPIEFIDQVFAVMALCGEHTFQVLTKRPARMLEYLRQIQDDEKDTHRWAAEAAGITRDPCSTGLVEDRDWPLPNVWLGVSVEDQATADERIPILLQTPAAVRFVSAEPLLGPVDFRFLQPRDPPIEINALAGTHGVLRPHGGVNDKLDWVIMGSESGPRARQMQIEWAESLRDQCKNAGVSFFTKQIANEHDRKGGDPQHWPPGSWPREFPV